MNGNATSKDLPSIDPQLKGWRKVTGDDGEMIIVPEWDTEENKKKYVRYEKSCYEEMWLQKTKFLQLL